MKVPAAGGPRRHGGPSWRPSKQSPAGPASTHLLNNVMPQKVKGWPVSPLLAFLSMS